MSTCSLDHTAGVILAAGYSKLSGRRPKVLAELNGKPVIQRAIEAHLTAGFKPVVVVVNPQDGALIRETVNAEQYEDGVRWCVQPERFGTADALRWAIKDMKPPIWVNKIVVSMGDFGLWSPDTLRDLIRTHLGEKKTKSNIPAKSMTVATVPLKYHRQVFSRYGLVIYAGDDASQPRYPKKIKKYWNGEVNEDADAKVSADLYCFSWYWVTRRLENMPAHESHDEGLPEEFYITDLVEKGYSDYWPAEELELEAHRAHEALSVNNDDNLRYVQEVISKIQEPIWQI